MIAEIAAVTETSETDEMTLRLSGTTVAGSVTGTGATAKETASGGAGHRPAPGDRRPAEISATATSR